MWRDTEHPKAERQDRMRDSEFGPEKDLVLEGDFSMKIIYAKSKKGPEQQ